MSSSKDTEDQEKKVAEFTRAVTSQEEDPIKGLDTTIKWQMVWLEAIALAWRDPAFKKKLIEQPRLTLLEYFNFDLGPYVKLTIREATPPEAQGTIPKTPLQHAFAGWDPAADPLKSEMIMALPPAPKVEDQAVALSFYNASGRAYPFTCC